MAQPEALQSPMAQGPGSLPSPDVSGEFSAMRSLASTPAAKTPAMNTPVKQSGNLGALDQLDAQAAPAPSQGADPLAALDQLDGAQQPQDSWGKIKDLLDKHGPEFVGGTLGGALTAAGIAATGGMGLLAGATLESGGITAGAMGARAVYDRGKQLVENLIDWAGNDPQKQAKAHAYLSQELTPSAGNLGQAAKEFGLGTVANLPATLSMGLLNRYVLSAASRGWNIADLEQAAKVRTEMQDVAKQVNEALQILPGMGAEETSVSGQQALKTLDDVSKGMYGITAKQQMATVLRTNAEAIDSSFKNILEQFPQAAKRGKMGDFESIKPSEMLPQWMESVGSKISEMKNQVLSEVGDKYANQIDPERILEMVQAPLAKNGLLDKQGNVIQSQIATPIEKKLARLYGEFRNNLQNYGAGAQAQGRLTMTELAQMGEQSSSMQGLNPTGRVINPSTGEAQWPTNVPIATKEGVSSSELNLPTQTTAGSAQVGGVPTRRASVSELNNFVDKLQALHGDALRAGEAISGDIGQASKELNLGYYNSLVDALPKGDPRGELLRRFSSQWAKNIDDVRLMNDRIKQAPYLAIDTMIPKGDTARSALTFHVLNQESGDALRGAFLQRMQENATDGGTRMLTGTALRKEIAGYPQEQLAQIFGSLEQVKSFQKAVNMAEMIERTSPKIAESVQEKQASQLAVAAVGAAKGGSMLRGVTRILRSMATDQNTPLAKIMDSIDFQNQLARQQRLLQNSPAISAAKASVKGISAAVTVPTIRRGQEVYDKGKQLGSQDY